VQRKLEPAARHTQPGQPPHVPRRVAAHGLGAGVPGNEQEPSAGTASDSGTASDDSTPRATRRITRAVSRRVLCRRWNVPSPLLIQCH